MNKHGRIQELEKLLSCEIIRSIDKGTSLEKYRANIDGTDVLLRVYSEGYYTNRYLRETISLRNLKGATTSFKVPNLIDEWPEYKIIAIEWIDFTGSVNNDVAIKCWKELSEIDNITIPFDLKDDLTHHLKNTENINQSYREIFEHQVRSVLSKIDWDAGKHSIVHGDFHLNNIGRTKDSIVLFDWEYTALGSSLYDLAYFQMVENIDTNDTRLRSWRGLVSLVILHWYLQLDQFNPKQVMRWVEKVKTEISKL